MIFQVNNFLIRGREKDKEFIESIDLTSIYEDVKNFFGFEKDLLIRLNFVSSPEEFVFFSGRNNFERWNVGQTSYFNTIILFSISSIEKCTNHKKSNLKGLLAHEIAHLFYGNSKFFNLPLFNEGIASYFKYKYSDEKPSFEFKGDSYPIRETKNFKDNYLAGYALIKKILVDKSSKEIMNFLKEVSSEDSDEILYEKFERVFSKNPLDFIKLEGGEL